MIKTGIHTNLDSDIEQASPNWRFLDNFRQAQGHCKKYIRNKFGIIIRAVRISLLMQGGLSMKLTVEFSQK